MRKIGTLILLILSLPLAGGCTTQSVVDAEIVMPLVGDATVDIENFAGDIHLEVIPELTEARVRVEREAVHGAERKEEAEASLEQIDYTVDIQEGPNGRVLTVRTWTDHQEPWFQRCHMEIALPGVRGITIRNTRGYVELKKIAGPVDITNTEGDVRLMTHYAMRDPVTINNNGGDIDYRVRGESSGEFDVTAVNGDVDHRVEFGTFPVQRMGSNRFIGTLNEGENPVILRTTDGDIRVAVVNNPLNVGLWIISP